jgi:hypothetical protein
VSLLVCLALAAAGRPVLPDRLGKEAQETFEGRQQVLRETERAGRLERINRVTQQRLKAKQSLIRQLIDREITLFEAAAWFRWLNENPADYQDRYRETYPGLNDEEKACRQVIGWVQVELKARGFDSRGEQEQAQLEVLLSEHIARHGRVVLPELW